MCECIFFSSSRRRHTSWPRDWSSDVCSSDLPEQCEAHWTSSIDIHCAPNTWDLECHQCRRHVSFAIPGPYLVYKSREFILFDSALTKINALRALLRRSTTQK